jgi:threonine synthase
VSTFYHSTRSIDKAVTSKQAILNGIAPDGGLYVCDSLLDEKLDIAQMVTQTYLEIAQTTLLHLLPEYAPEEIAACVEGAYTNTFDTPDITPITPLGNDWLLELFHGPTCAFKDVALQMLPRLMSVARTSAHAGNVMIVTATSGDTGKAALEGFKDVEGCGVSVFYPAGKVSDIQRLQMVTQRGNNVAVCGIRGNFDDAQTEVKHIFQDADLARRLAESNTVLSSANSINVGRLVPQVCYYLFAYAQLVARGAVTLGDAVDFVVPTGNFGDVLAGYFAKRLGLPVGKLVVASNANNVLTDFITTGVYDRRRAFHKTISPSMDILVSSNVERLLYYISEGDVEFVAHCMHGLAIDGTYALGDKILQQLRATFACGCADDDMTRATIRSTWESEHVLIDTHTAVAKCVLDALPREGRQRICLSTASPYKFSQDVLVALGQNTAGMDGFACMDLLEKITGVSVPAPLASLRELDELHPSVCDRQEMGAFVEASAAKIFSK